MHSLQKPRPSISIYIYLHIKCRKRDHCISAPVSNAAFYTPVSLPVLENSTHFRHFLLKYRAEIHISCIYVYYALHFIYIYILTEHTYDTVSIYAYKM